MATALPTPAAICHSSSNKLLLPPSSSPAPSNFKPIALRTSLLGAPLFLAPKLALLHPRRSSAPISVTSMLPTANPGTASTENLPNGSRWSARAIKSFAMGELEARKLKYPNTGTEALLMGILVEGTSVAARFLRANGITLFKVREETVKLLGKSDMYYFSPEHPPLTEPAQKALDWAVEEKKKSGTDGEVTTTHLLLGIWSEKDSAGHKILASLGFDDEKASELAKSAHKDYEFNYK